MGWSSSLDASASLSTHTASVLLTATFIVGDDVPAVEDSPGAAIPERVLQPVAASMPTNPIANIRECTLPHMSAAYGSTRRLRALTHQELAPGALLPG